MARTRGLLVGDRFFRTQLEAREFCQGILYSYPEGAAVTDPGHVAFLADLVLLHPDAEEKVGAGLAGFEVRQNLKTPGFWILRTDGTETDFSFLKCVRSPTHVGTVRAAMRRAIVGQVLAAKDEAFGGAVQLVCPVTGEPITRETCHVDHYNPTFVELADGFAAGEGGYERLQVVSQDREIGSRLADNAALERWRHFHAANANLRMVSVTANLSILNRVSDQ